MRIKSFSSCNDWYFIFETTILPVVGFAVIEGDERDTIVGMTSVEGGDGYSYMPSTCHLVTVPSVKGKYVHKSEINQTLKMMEEA